MSAAVKIMSRDIALDHASDLVMHAHNSLLHGDLLATFDIHHRCLLCKRGAL